MTPKRPEIQAETASAGPDCKSALPSLQADAPLHVQQQTRGTTDTSSGFLPPCAVPTESGESKPGASSGLRVGMAWNGADNVPGKTPAETAARHDLVLSGPESFGLRWNADSNKGLATSFTPESIKAAREHHQALVEQNPELKSLAEVRYRDAPSDYLPSDSKWWLQNKDGNAVSGYDGKGLDYKMLDIRNPALQDHVAEQAAAIVKTGAVDGVMFDWFNDGKLQGKEWDDARLQMLTKVRAAIGPDAKIFINTNDKQMPDAVAKLVDGYYMEANQSSTPADWKRITAAVDNAERQGKMPFLETWPDEKSGRQELNKMRATMTLAMTHAPDGYALFADADGTNKQEHLHDWYPFYDADVGKPAGPLEPFQGGSRREYQNGTVVYNPIGNKSVTVEFPEARTSAATGKTGRSFVVNPEDGDIFLK